MEFKCSCLRIESFGLPCVHIIAVLVHLDVDGLPKSLVLERWAKQAKQSIKSRIIREPIMGDSVLYRSRVGSFVHHCKRFAKVACLVDEDYYEMWDKVANETLQLEMKRGLVVGKGDKGGMCYAGLKNPAVVRTKGCGSAYAAASTKGKRRRRCGFCNGEGHTRTTCREIGLTTMVGDETGDQSVAEEDFDGDVRSCEFLVTK